MRELVLATRSRGKLAELQPLCSALGYVARTLEDVGVVESADEEGIEAFDTFEENALAKARYFWARCGGRPVIADDSGLVVEALGGAPGVHSRRWSGRNDLTGKALDDANNARLAGLMRDQVDRRASYVCVAVWLRQGQELLARGETSGRILEVAAGAGGFGYDPLFLSDDLGVSFGEATREAKAGVSHRGRALRALMTQVRAGR